MRERPNPKKYLWIAITLLLFVALLGFLTPRTNAPFAQYNQKEKQRSSAIQAQPSSGSLSSTLSGSTNSSVLSKRGVASALPVKLPLASPKVVSAYPGPRVKAVVTVKGEPRALEPNDAGEFPRIFVGVKSKTPIKLSLPETQPGDLVQIESEDGGQILDSKSSGMIGKIDDDKSVGFIFATAQDEGMYRIRVRSGADFKLLTLWAGEPPHYAKGN